MKFLKYFMALVAAAGIMTACESDLEEVKTYDPSNVVAPVLNDLDTDAVVITGDNKDTGILSLSWSAADFGAATQINYSVLVAAEGNEIAVVGGISENKTDVAYAVLNNALALSVEDGGLGLPVETASEVSIRIAATVGANFPSFYSNAKTISVTPTSAEKQYPVVYVIGTLNGWSHATVAANSDFLYNFAEDDKVYEGIVDFGLNADGVSNAAAGWKISIAGDKWNDEGNWGLDGAAEAPEAEAKEVSLICSGGSSDLKIYSKRYYHFAFDKSGLTLKNTLSFDQMGVIGLNGDWNNDVVMEFNKAKRRFYVDITADTDTEIKFRTDASWETTNWGVKDGVVATGGDNIPVAAGSYRVYFYLSNSADVYYELDAKMFGKEEPVNGGSSTPTPSVPAWAIHGQTAADAEWKDYEMKESGDAYVLQNVEFAAGNQFGFKKEGTWMSAVSETDPFKPTVDVEFDITAEGGKNIEIATAGKYDIYVYPTTNKAVVKSTSIPEPEADRWGLIGSMTGWGYDLYLDEVEGVENLFVRKNFAVTTADEFKVRFNNSWEPNTMNYGLDGGGAIAPNTYLAVVDGEAGGSNTKVTADGTYDFYFDLANLRFYLMEAGKPYTEATEGTAQEPEQPVVDLTAHTWSVIGIGGDWNTDVEMTISGTMASVKEVNIAANQGFKLRADKGWDLSYGTAGEPAEGTDYVIVVVDEAFAGVNNGKNMAVATAGIYDIYFDLSNGDIYVMNSGNTPGGDTPAGISWGLCGTITDWGQKEDIALTLDTTLSMYVAKNCAFVAGDKFKIRANGEWNDLYNYGFQAEGNIPVNVASKLVLGSASKDMIVAAAGTYDVYFDLANTTLYFMEQGKTPAESEKPSSSASEWGIVGVYNNWSAPDTKLYTTQTEGLFVAKNFTINAFEDFKFRTNDTWGNELTSSIVGIKANSWVAAGTGANNTSVCVAGTYDIYLDTVNGRIYVMETGKDISAATEQTTSVTLPDDSIVFGLVGGHNGWAAPDIKMTFEGGYYVAKNATLDTEFKIRGNEAWNDAYNYGATTDGFTATVGQAIELTLGSGSKNIGVASGTYDVYFDKTNLKAWVMPVGQKPAN